jgi:hypothetical protein
MIISLVFPAWRNLEFCWLALNCLSALIAKGNALISLIACLILFNDCFVYETEAAGKPRKRIEQIQLCGCAALQHKPAARATPLAQAGG